ncbi:FMRFamide receptor [Echinococcus granulosus]|nr:FMRFamide receptor [Echinococcus granulosus]EUB64704.1 FMRFamide receptor [Echinococcus granulosus]
MLNVTNSPNVYRRYPDGLLIKRFLPEVFELKLYASPIWFVVGLIGNAISFFIWVSERQRGKNSSAVYLATLALTDLLLIICLFTEYLRLYLFLSSSLSVNGICQLFQGVFLFLQYYSIVLTFGFTLERWIAICYPFKRQKLCSTTRALVGVSLLAVIVACFSIFFASTWEVVDGACILANQWQNDTTFSIYLSTTECIFSLIVPIATLVFNILVLREIGHLVKSKILVSRGNSSTHHVSIVRRLHHNHNYQHHQQVARTGTIKQSSEPLVLGAKHSSAHASAKEQANFQAVTIMLVILSFYLILCTLPVGIVFVVQMRFTDIPDNITDEEILANPAWQQYLRFLTAKEIIDFLCSSHYACNFIIYVLTGKSFRQHLKDILLCRHQQTRTEMTSAHYPKATCLREKIKRVDKLIPNEKGEEHKYNHRDLNCHEKKGT